MQRGAEILKAQSWRSNIRKATPWLLRLIGLALVVMIYSSVDLTSSFEILGQIGLFDFLLLIVLSLACTVIRTYKWYLIAKRNVDGIGFFNAFRYQLIGIFLGALTPGRIGESTKALYLRKHGNSGLTRDLLGTLVDRFMELVGFLFLTAFILTYYLFFKGVNNSVINYAVGAMLVFLVLLTAAWRFRNSILMGFGFVLRYLCLNYLVVKVGIIQKEVAILGLGEVTRYLGISILVWLGYYLIYINAADALCINLGFLQIIVAAGIAGLAVMLPISIAGIGTREAALIYIFKVYGAEKSFAISLSLLVLSLNIAIILLGFLSYYYELHHFRRRRVWRNEGS